MTEPTPEEIGMARDYLWKSGEVDRVKIFLAGLAAGEQRRQKRDVKIAKSVSYMEEVEHDGPEGDDDIIKMPKTALQMRADIVAAILAEGGGE